MRRPKAGEVWRSGSSVSREWEKVKVVEVLGNFVSYCQMTDGFEATRVVPGFVDDFVKRYSPPPLQLPDAQAILPLTAGGFRAAVLDIGIWPADVIALVKVTVVDNMVSVELEEPE